MTEETRVKTLSILAAIVIALGGLGWPQTVLAQGASPNAAMAGRITEARKANAVPRRARTSRKDMIREDSPAAPDLRVLGAEATLPGDRLESSRTWEPPSAGDKEKS